MSEPSELSSPPEPELVPLPEVGRTFSATRRVRWGDTDASGRLRLDALARYLQDIANDDTRDAGHDPFAPWVVRRTAVSVVEPIRLGDLVTLTTFNGGTGSRWAERRTSVLAAEGGHLEVASLWIYVDPVSGRPARLTEAFHATYAEAGGGREVKARLQHGPPPAAATSRPWPLRSTDVDQLGHVNNAATWEAVEDEAARRGIVATRAEIEYPDAIAPDAAVDLRSAVAPDGSLHLWLVVDGRPRASAVLTP